MGLRTRREAWRGEGVVAEAVRGEHLASLQTVAASALRAGLGLPGSSSCSATFTMITELCSAHRSLVRLRVSVPAPGLWSLAMASQVPAGLVCP